MIRKSRGVAPFLCDLETEKGKRGTMGVDLAAIRKRMQELQNGRRNSNVQLWKPKEAGEYIVRALPWPAAMVQPGQPFIERWFYYIGDGFGTLTLHQFGKPDPIKEFIDSLYASGKPEDKEIAKKLRPKMQAYLPIVVKKGKDADPEKVLVYSINKFLYQKMLGWFLDDDVGDYTDPAEGFDIKVTLTDAGKKFRGKTVLNSDVELARKQTKLAATPEEIKKLFESIPDVNDMHTAKDYAELEKELQTWLDGGARGGAADDSDATDTKSGGSSSSTDALDELANDIKGSTKADEKPPVEEKKASTKAPKEKKKKDDEEESTAPKQSLDEAFDELMRDDA